MTSRRAAESPTALPAGEGPTRLQLTMAKTLMSVVALGFLALLLLNCNAIAPQNGWSEAWGPLVPHESFPGDCSVCHTTEDWTTLRAEFTFDHEAETGHALRGAHATASCLRCHNDRGPVAAYARRGCGGCHVDPHRDRLGADCELCHHDADWRAIGWVADHGRTRLPLVGRHAVTPCESCHERAPLAEFDGAPVQCELCHQESLAIAIVPDHAANGWTAACERCHTPISWSSARVDHGFFPLVLGHGGLDCSRCHSGPVFSGLSRDCFSCHAPDYQSAPGHVASGFSRDCTGCHTLASWEPTLFRHDFFPLVLGHAGLDCSRCHTAGVFSGASSDCYSCHADEFQRAPGHVAQGFSQDCTGCHSLVSWDAATFDHSRFPLAGGHGGLSCTRCHTTGSFGPIPATCSSCHLADYQRAPDHSSLQISTDCTACHDTIAWRPSSFTHSFPLSGPHNTSCATCHATNAATFDCLGCHAHRQSEADAEHREVRDYRYDSQACYSCHPNGRH